MGLPILRRIDANNAESIAEAEDDGFYFVEDLVTYEIRMQAARHAFHIRPALGSDICEVMQIVLHEMRHSRLYADPQIPPEIAQEAYRKRVGDGFTKADCFVACYNSVIVGFAALYGSEIGLIAVDRKYQRNRVGVRLIEACIERCRANGFDTLTAKTQGSNNTARRFWEILGFTQTKVEKDYHKHEPRGEGESKPLRDQTESDIPEQNERAKN